MEDRDAVLRHYRESREALLAAIHGLSDAQLTERSLDGWSVKDHLAHIALWDDLRTSEVTRISAGYDSAWRGTGEQAEAYNAMGHAMRGALSIDQVRWELATSRARLLEAIVAATPRGLDPKRYGDTALVSTHEAEHTGWIRRWRTERGF
jgi:uncharacterized damage-inducible protein DinB